MKLLKAALVTFALVACACSASIEGKSGQLEFSYQTAKANFEDAPAVAVGSKITIEARPAGASTDSDAPTISLSDVTSSDPQVMTVRSIDEHQFTLEAVAAGEVEINVEGSRDGAAVTDAFDLTTGDVARVEMDDVCGEDEVVYLTDEEVLVDYTMRDSDDNQLAGFDYWPVELTDDTEAQLDSEHNGVGYLKVQTGAKPGTTSVEPAVEGDSFDMQIIGDVAIDELTIMEKDIAQSVTVTVGDKNYLHPEFISSGKPVCQGATDVQVDVQTPEICDVTTESNLNEDDAIGTLARAKSSFVIEGKQTGTCRFEATAPRARNGDGVSTTIDIEVESPSDADNTLDD